MTNMRLTRNLEEAMLGGVMSGVASRNNWDPTLVRIVAALVILATGVIPGVLLYLVAWVIIPRADVPEVMPPESRTPSTEDTTSNEGEAAAENGPRPAAVVDEITETLRDTADRLGEAATIAADAARRAANEIGDIARRPREAGGAPPPPADGSEDGPPSEDATEFPAAVAAEAPAEAAPEETVDLPPDQRPSRPGPPDRPL